MKTLQDVAKSYKKAAGKAIYPGVSYSGYKTGTSKAFATGNLLSKFVTSPRNQPSIIGRENKATGTYTFILDIAPFGAEYGKYVHYGTSKMKERPFGELATEDNAFKQTLEEFISTQVGEVAAGYVDQMDSNFEKAGFTVS